MKFSQLSLSQRLTPSEVNPNIFRTSTSDECIILAIYVEDIFVIGSDIFSITRFKVYLHQHLTIRDLGTPKYFLGIEFAYQPRKLVLNQMKYVLDILTKIKLLLCKPSTLPIDSKPNFWESTSPLLAHICAYR